MKNPIYDLLCFAIGYSLWGFAFAIAVASTVITIDTPLIDIAMFSWYFGCLIILVPFIYDNISWVYKKIRVRCICNQMLKDYHKLLKEQELQK